MTSTLFSIEVARRLMRENDIVGLISSSPENSYYVSGTYNISHYVFREIRPVITIIPLESDPVLICHKWELKQTISETWFQDVRTYDMFESYVVKHSIEALSEVLREKRLADRRVGLELSQMTLKDWSALKKRMPDAVFVECGKLFQEMRMTKSEDEIRTLQKAAKITEKSIYQAFENARPGATEKQIAEGIVANLIMGGSDLAFSPSYSIDVGSGERSLLNHAAPTDKVIPTGEMIFVDFGGIFSGYHSDISAMGIVGKPTSEQKETYNRLITVHRETIRAARSGKTGSDVFNSYLDSAKANGLLADPNGYGLAGHGIGLKIHEEPIFDPLNKTVLKENMVVCVEIAYRAPWPQTVVAEDLVRITDQGGELLSDVQEEIYSIS